MSAESQVLTGSATGAGGVPLFARQKGRGPPVLFVHGSASDHRTWDGTIGSVPGSFRAVAYSRRGHHPNSSPTMDTYRFDEQLADLMSVVEELGDEGVSLVGHSSGAVMCLLAAAHRPGAVTRMVLVEPPCFTLYVSDPPRPGEIARLMIRDPRLGIALLRFGATALGPAKSAARRGDREAAIRRFGKGVLGRQAFERLSPARRQQVEENVSLAEIIGPAFPRLDSAEIARVVCPVLVVSGAESPAFLRLLAQRLAAMLPSAELLAIPGASHIVHEDAAVTFQQALLAFLRRDD